jgi:hypothetical protein
MLKFYAQISASNSIVGNLMLSLRALTRLNRAQIRVFSADSDWNSWGI